MDACPVHLNLLDLIYPGYTLIGIVNLFQSYYFDVHLVNYYRTVPINLKC